MYSDRKIHFKIIPSLKEKAPNLLLVMGYSGSLEAWPKVFLNEVSKNYQIIILDNLGTGLSPKPKEKESYQISELAKDLDSVIQSSEIKKFHLLGYSLGGCIALEYALNSKSNNIESLTLLSTTAGGKAYTSPGENILNKLENPTGKDLLELSRSIWELCLSESHLEKHIEVLKSSIVYEKDKLTPRFALRNQLWAYKNFNRSEDMSFNFPVKVITGDKDPLTHAENSIRLSKLIKNSQLIILKDCEHMPHIECPELLIESLMK